jgi:hypothetical protein
MDNSEWLFETTFRGIDVISIVKYLKKGKIPDATFSDNDCLLHSILKKQLGL